MRAHDSVQVFSDKYLENISDAFRTLYSEEQLSDVTIHCKEGSIKAHKLILAANSPYFCKIFRENRNDYPIVILHGITIDQLKYLMNLLYQGTVDIPSSDVDAVSSLVKEFEIKGVVFGEREANNVTLELGQHSQTVSPESAHNRDTRFKGQKRVAVDFVYREEMPHSRAPSTSSIHSNDSRTSRRTVQGDVQSNSQRPTPIVVKREIPSPVPSSQSSVYTMSDVESISSERRAALGNGVQKLNAWARKQRKFKCDLCPSSFKRSSHLSRHQLVHTGERPYSCSQCDKAFSRHDKLKHHIRKAHEFIPDSMYEKIDMENDDSEMETCGENFSSSLQNGGAASTPSTSNAMYESTRMPDSSFKRENSPLFTISHITSILEDSFVKPPKKGRGRPRKYPPTDLPPQNSNQEFPQSDSRSGIEEIISSSDTEIYDEDSIDEFATLTKRRKNQMDEESGLRDQRLSNEIDSDGDSSFQNDLFDDLSTINGIATPDIDQMTNSPLCTISHVGSVIQDNFSELTGKTEISKYNSSGDTNIAESSVPSSSIEDKSILTESTQNVSDRKIPVGEPVVVLKKLPVIGDDNKKCEEKRSPPLKIPNKEAAPIKRKRGRPKKKLYFQPKKHKATPILDPLVLVEIDTRVGTSRNKNTQSEDGSAAISYKDKHKSPGNKYARTAGKLCC